MQSVECPVWRDLTARSGSNSVIDPLNRPPQAVSHQCILAHPELDIDEAGDVADVRTLRLRTPTRPSPSISRIVPTHCPEQDRGDRQERALRLARPPSGARITSCQRAWCVAFRDLCRRASRGSCRDGRCGDSPSARCPRIAPAFRGPALRASSGRPATRRR